MDMTDLTGPLDGYPPEVTAARPPGGYMGPYVDDRLDIIVPVWRRPAAAARFVDSLRAAGGIERVRVMAVFSPDDVATGEAWVAAGADVISAPGSPPSYPLKVRWAWQALRRDIGGRPFGPPGRWCLLVGDDVAFAPGWVDAARYEIAQAEADGMAVLGTDDHGFERGAASCVHPLIDATYVDRNGLTFAAAVGGLGDPGAWPVSLAYRHNYVDAEMRATAEHAGVFRPAPSVEIVHLHHQWRRAPVDDVYEAGTAALFDDRALFERRYERWVNAGRPVLRLTEPGPSSVQ